MTFFQFGQKNYVEGGQLIGKGYRRTRGGRGTGGGRRGTRGERGQDWWRESQDGHREDRKGREGWTGSVKLHYLLLVFLQLKRPLEQPHFVCLPSHFHGGLNSFVGACTHFNRIGIDYRTRNGFETWRRLTQTYLPQHKARSVGPLTHIRGSFPRAQL